MFSYFHDSITGIFLCCFFHDTNLVHFYFKNMDCILDKMDH